MSCNHCKMAVNEALASVAGVSTESVEIGRAVITADNWTDVAASVGEKGVVPPEFTMPRFHEELYMQNFEDKRLIVHRMMAIR